MEAEPEAEAASAAVLELAERMKLPSLFKKYDADGDGVLSKAEVTAMMNAIGLKGEKRLLAKTLPHRMCRVQSDANTPRPKLTSRMNNEFR